MKIINANTQPASVDVECILPNKQLASPQPVVELFCLAQTIALNQSFQKITKKLIISNIPAVQCHCLCGNISYQVIVL